MGREERVVVLMLLLGRWVVPQPPSPFNDGWDGWMDVYVRLCYASACFAMLSRVVSVVGQHTHTRDTHYIAVV